MKKKNIVLIFLIILFLFLGIPHFTKVENFQYVNDELKNKDTIKILTYNIHYGSGSKEDINNQKENLNELINLLNKVDFAILQEVDFNVHRTNGINQFKYLAKKSGMNYASFLNNWNFKLPFIKPIYFNNLKTGHVILSRFPLESKSEFFQKPEESSLWHEIFFLTRTQLYSDIDILGKKLRIFNVHLEGENKKDRESQAKQLKKLVQGSPYPVILAGDFNALVNSNDTTMEIIKETKLSEVTEGKYTFPSNNPIQKIDYIFISQEIKVKSMEVLNVGFSDHLPIISEFFIPD